MVGAWMAVDVSGGCFGACRFSGRGWALCVLTCVVGPVGMGGLAGCWWLLFWAWL